MPRPQEAACLRCVLFQVEARAKVQCAVILPTDGRPDCGRTRPHKNTFNSGRSMVLSTCTCLSCSKEADIAGLRGTVLNAGSTKRDRKESHALDENRFANVVIQRRGSDASAGTTCWAATEAR